MRKTVLVAISIFAMLRSQAAPPTVSSFTPTSAVSGQTVTITGTNFTSISSVTFGGTAAASFVVVSTTQITAVVASGTSGFVQVTGAGGSGSKTGFFYVSTSRIVTDFAGYWSSLATSNNATLPDSSHNLLAFTYNNTLYSTGVNDATLTSHSLSFTAGSFRALPVAGITGTNTGSTSTYLALARKVDGSVNVAYTPAVSSFNVKSVLTDGQNGLDLGTGVTNLPATAVLTFQISNINPSKVADSEPDIILTQIAQPVAGNDVYSFIDGSGTIVGTTFTQDMTLLPKFGSYTLDLFNLTPNTPFNTASAYSAFATNTTREIRVVAVKLSDFGITPANVGSVKALRITPSGNSDYAFVAYNTNAINLPPNVNRDQTNSNTTLCSGGTANMEVIASPAGSGALSYQWERSTNGGSTWTTVTNGGSYSGATTERLTVVNPSNNDQYHAIVTEAGNANTATSNAFVITVNSPTPPSSVSISGGGSTCLGSPVQLSSTVTGGSNLFYQWQSNQSGSFADIPEANNAVYTPVVGATGAISYQLKVSSGSGCGGTLTSSPATVTVTGVSGTTAASRCNTGTVTLNATATSGTISWYDVDAGGSAVFTGNSFTTPSLSASTTYYVSASGCASALRVPVTATVYAPTNGGNLSGDTIVVSGTNSVTMNLNGNTGDILLWQSSTDTFHLVVSDITNTSNILTVNNVSTNTQYRVVSQNGVCPSALSGIAYVRVSTVLPVTSSGLTGKRVGNGILLDWTGFNLEQTTSYNLERSADGSQFNNIGTIYTPGLSASKHFQWLDAAPLDGANYYRLRENYSTGRSELGKTIKVNWTTAINGFRVFPNPVEGKTIQLNGNGAPAGKYEVVLYGMNGQLYLSRELLWNGQSAIINVPASMQTGQYKLEIKNDGGEYRQTVAVFIQ